VVRRGIGRLLHCEGRRLARKLAFVYFEDEPGRSAAKLLTRDEARQIAVNMREIAGATKSVVLELF
jgi:hypothetical protein